MISELEKEQLRIALDVMSGARLNRDNSDWRYTLSLLGGSYDDDGMGWDNVDFESMARSLAAKVVFNLVVRALGEG